jgi:hypothetical protein
MSACGTLLARRPLLLVLASAAFAAPAAAGQTTIDLTYESVMDMVRPDVHPGVKVHHNLQVILSEDNQVSETHNRNASGLSDKFARQQALGSGDAQGSFEPVWHVVSKDELVRIQNEPQSTRTITVTLTSSTTCSIAVKDELKPGYAEYAFPRIGQHALAYFTGYQIVGSTCAIH